MPGSIDENESPQILKYVGSVGFLVFSVAMTAFGYTNNAWVVMERTKAMDEFQRGVRGHDCYKTYRPENITCLPWGYENKAEKFPPSLQNVQDASIEIQVASYIAIIIMLSQGFWLAYTIGHCCSIKFCQGFEKYRFVMFHAMVISVGLWIILFFVIVYETFTDQILYRSQQEADYSHQIGTGCWIFFLGGLLPFVGAMYCLFAEQMQQSQDWIQHFVNNPRQRVPTTDTTQGAEVVIPMNTTAQ
ncbi:hypothetical protein B9Z55_024528 [Caenorhabditis nigoni]|uniref:Uncharacterized protein n=1 Tax=Caenorhabditis nigoni TaxID=1611254 RepID=A0A2G5SV79_9PELO|nr:hypothetical protein B9Z55_024528 [Caenorhabditis nigoni]